MELGSQQILEFFFRYGSIFINDLFSHLQASSLIYFQGPVTCDGTHAAFVQHQNANKIVFNRILFVEYSPFLSVKNLGGRLSKWASLVK